VSELQVDGLPAQLPSGRHGLSRTDVIASQRARLLGAAIRVAGEDGYAAMTVSAVIAHAGVSRKTFYELFTDREACFLAAYDVVAARAQAGVEHAYAIDAPWAERVRAALGWLLRTLAARPLEARMGVVEALAAGPRALARRDRLRATFAQLLAPGFDVAPARIAVPGLMPEAIVGGIETVLFAHVHGGRTAELPALLPELLFCVLAPFLGPADAADAARLRTAPGRRRQAADRVDSLDERRSAQPVAAGWSRLDAHSRQPQPGNRVGPHECWIGRKRCNPRGGCPHGARVLRGFPRRANRAVIVRVRVHAEEMGGHLLDRIVEQRRLRREQRPVDARPRRDAHVILAAGGVPDEEHLVGRQDLDLVGNDRRDDVVGMRGVRQRDGERQAECGDACSATHAALVA